VLVRVVDALDSLDLNNKDIMGDVYEYLLSQIAQSGTNGQFRTPRHIIKMMVELMQPTLNDTICDPAMGSAGFITTAAQYVTEHYKSELMKKENKQHYTTTMFTGFDTDQTMLRIGAMNMMLHGVEAPNITWMDSLSEDNTHREEYSLILANPPFTGSLDKETISKDLLTLAATKKTELLFMALFLKALKIGGRCASIVPDGVLFGSSKAHKAIRQELVENNRLEAVISMPSGVFKPYAGVSTAVLVFTKTGADSPDMVWFYDMHADGFTLDDKRSEIAENEFCTGIDCIAVTGDETVENGDIITQIEQIFRTGTADITGTSANENFFHFLQTSFSFCETHIHKIHPVMFFFNSGYGFYRFFSCFFLNFSIFSAKRPCRKNFFS
jgi:type I restriction enzyme M protein